MNKALKGLTLSAYVLLACTMALLTLAMSFVSDGPVPLYVRVTVPVVVLLIFIAPLVIWRKMKAGAISSPLPTGLRKHQDKIIVVGLLLWAVGAAISYMVTRGN